MRVCVSVCVWGRWDTNRRELLLCLYAIHTHTHTHTYEHRAQNACYFTFNTSRGACTINRLVDKPTTRKPTAHFGPNRERNRERERDCVCGWTGFWMYACGCLCVTALLLLLLCISSFAYSSSPTLTCCCCSCSLWIIEGVSSMHTRTYTDICSACVCVSVCIAYTA